jgi:calcineurin-like phosphoesterase family protein
MQVMQKISDEVYDKLYVTSDTHFGHNKEFLYEPRGYKNSKEMNSDMISIINSTVGEDGILLHLGDFCLNTTQEEYHEILKNLKIKEIWMLWGNHNNPIQKSYGGTREQIAAHNNGIFIRYLNHYYTFKNKNNLFVCSHYPFQSWEGMSEGSMHLHGHCHNNLLTSREDDKTNKILDVGWDTFNRPLHITEISEIMKTKGLPNT